MKKFSEGFDIDLQDPALLRDIRLSDDKLAVLREQRDKCFLCKWILEDYEKNKTLTGVKQEGEGGVYEIMPIRGEINHVWLEVYGKEYPFKRKVTPDESRVHGHKPPEISVAAKPAPSAPPPSVPATTPSTPAAAPVAPPPTSDIPLSKPKRL